MCVGGFVGLGHSCQRMFNGFFSNNWFYTKNRIRKSEVIKPSFSKRLLDSRFFLGITRKLIASSASFAVAFTPIATSFIPHHAYAQQIIIDPSAPSTTLFSSGNGTPQINIATPQSGISQNKFSDFNVGSDGLILNNSQSGGKSVIGGSVGANSNLSTSGPATVILNEVTSSNASTLTGTTEVFGGKAAVIIANPNGIGCNGCNFINTNRTTLTTGWPTVNGDQVDLRVAEGTVNIGRGGFNSEGSADLIGRHVIIDGEVQADDDLIVSGGSQQFNYNNSSRQSAPILNVKKSPFAVDATQFGALTAGNIRIHGNESGLGVNAYGDISTSGNVRLSSSGDLFYGNVQSSGEGLNRIDARRAIRQYGNAEFNGDVEVSGRSFTLYNDKTLETSGNVTIDARDFVVVVGEVAAQDITVDTASSITNNGFLLADGDLVIVAGDDIINERQIATEYDVYYDPAIQQYLAAYQSQLINGTIDEQEVAAEFLARAEAHDIIQEYVQRGATLLGENVRLEANLDIDLEALENDSNYNESGDIRNIGGAIIGTRSVALTAGESIVNNFVSLRRRLTQDDNCTAADCIERFRTDFHSAEILSGGDINLNANFNIENRAGIIAAAGNIVANAGQDILNLAQINEFRVNTTSTIRVPNGQRISGYREDCSGGGDTYQCEQVPIYETTYGTRDITTSSEHTVVTSPTITTLHGDLSLNAELDYVSTGGELSAGNNLSIDVGGQVFLASLSDVDKIQGLSTRHIPSRSTCDRDHNCSIISASQSTSTSTTFDFSSATSTIQGNNIRIEADSDIAVLGASILAAENLNIQSLNGSVLIDSTDLPDEVIGTEFVEVDFRELGNDANARLFQDADLANDFENFIEENPLLAAVDTLSRADSPNQLREVVRSVGLQDGRSIFGANLAQSVDDLRAEQEIRNLQDREQLQNVNELEQITNDEADQYIARGTVVVGEESAAVALANFGFEGESIASIDAVDLARDFGINRDGTDLGLQSSNSLAQINAQDIIAEFEALVDPSQEVIYGQSSAGHAREITDLGENGSIVKYTDTTNQADWSEYTVYKNADGENEVYVLHYDDGRTREYTYGGSGGEAWERHTKWYDADGRVVSEITLFDEGRDERKTITYNDSGQVLSETVNLVGGGVETSTFLYTGDVVASENIIFADGTSKFISFSNDETKTWDNNETDYDAAGNRLSRTYNYKDQTKTYQIYDTDGSQEWSNQAYRYTADGKLRHATKYNDDGTREVTGYDYYEEGKSWSFTTNYYDADRKRTKLVYANDDGSFDEYLYDTASNKSWTRQIKHYTSEGVHDRITWEYDNGRKTTRNYDRDNEEAWNIRIVRYNEDGSILSTQIVADVENTLAEANYGEFFAATSHRFANAGGLTQLASTPRAILYADNDLNLTAGRFVSTRVEDVSIASRSYTRSSDLATTFGITNRNVDETDDNSINGDTTFPVFAEVIASVVTSETPVSETQSTNSAGTNVHRKNYADGTYEVEYAATDGLRYVYYYDASGTTVAQRYFYVDGRVRNRVYATTSTDAETAETITQNQVDVYYDVEGRVRTVDEYEQDGSRTRSTYDVDSDRNWSNYKSSYSSDGELIGLDYLYDDGERLVYDYDVNSEDDWDRTITRYNRQGQIESITEELDDGGRIVTNNDFADTEEWVSQIITTAADGTVTTTLVDDLDRSNTRLEDRLRGNGDIYVLGSSTVAAGNNVNINASRRVGILGAINTNFHLTNNSNLQHANFDLVGENLQLGALYHDTEDTNVGVLLDNDGNPVLDANGNLIRTQTDVAGDDWFGGNDGTIESTRNYRLTNTVINAGGDLSINASTTWNVESDIVNYGGSLIAGGNAYITSDGDIRNEVLRHNFSLTRDHGCVGRACGREGHDYKPAEILAGSGLIIAAGGSVTNYGSNIGAAGAILISAEEDIINDAITSQYLYHYINSSSTFGLKRRKEILHRAIIQEGNISSTYGSITLDAGNDIRNHASLISAGGDITLDAEGDIELYAKSEEVHNFIKRRSIGFLSISQQETRYNEFGTAFSTLEGNNIYATAGNNLIGTGTIANAASDLVLNAGNDVTFDAHQNIRYRETEGWSFGISFPGSNIIAALVEGGDLSEALDAYIGSNPVLAAAHQLATARNGDQTRSAILGLGITVLQESAGANRRAEAAGISRTEALAQTFNPFAGGPLDFTNAGATPPVEGAPQTNGTGAGQDAGSFLDGITFRFSAYESREEWTESFVSKLTAGQDLDFSAGNNVQLVGGTIATAGRDAYLYAEQDILVTALADTRTSQSSGWGASIGFAGGGVTIGGHANSASSDAQLFTNAGITAGENLDFYSGRDTTFAGANVAATDISIYSGRDLVVQSRQNISNSESSGWNASVTFSPAGIPVGGSFSGSSANANRQYTDTPTTIIGENSLDIYTEGRTWLVGSILDVSNSVDETQVVSAFDFDGRYTGNAARGLSLNTGQFVFDNLNDVDQSESISGGINLGYDAQARNGEGALSYGTTPFAYSYHDRRGITFATVGEGAIRVRDVADGNVFDFRALNRNANDAQRLIRDESFELNLPAIELSSLSQNLQDSREFFAGLSEESNFIREAINSDRAILEAALGLRGETLRNLVKSPGFSRNIRFHRFFGDLIEQFGSIARVPFELLDDRVDRLNLSDEQRDGYRSAIGRLESYSTALSTSEFSGTTGRDFNNDGTIDQSEIDRFNKNRKIAKILVLFGEIVNEIGSTEINDGVGGTITIDELSGEISGLFFRAILDFERARNGEASARKLEQSLRELGGEFSDFVTSTAERHAEDYGLSSEEETNLSTGIMAAPAIATGGLLGVGVRGGVRNVNGPDLDGSSLNPSDVGFSQATVSRVTSDGLTIDELTESLQTNGWLGDPIDVVNMPDGVFTSLDNRRLLAARRAGVDVQANIRNFDEALTASEIQRFRVGGQPIPRTWGDAAQLRIQRQGNFPGVDSTWPERFPNGSIFDPIIIE